MAFKTIDETQAKARLDEIQGEIEGIAEIAERENRANLTKDETTKFRALIEERDLIRGQLKTQAGRNHAAGMRRDLELPGGNPGSSRGEPSTAKPGNIRDYASFHGIPKERLSTGGFSSLGEFLQVLDSGRFDSRISSLTASGVGGVTGAVFVPDAFLIDFLSPPSEGEIVLPRCTPYPMGQVQSMHICAVEYLDESTGAVAGFAAQWVEEHGEFDEQELKTGKIVLNRKKLGIFHIASNEIAGNAGFVSGLETALNTATASHRDFAFINGNGVGKPKGLLNDPAKITVAKEGGQAAATINYTNVVNMLARLHPALHQNAVWLAHPDTLPQLLSLALVIGTGGEARPLMSESNGTYRLMGKEVLFTSKVPTLGTEGDLILVDLSQYAVGVGEGIMIQKSEHVRFQKDQTAWRVVYRCDGQGRWGKVFKPRSGATKSFVVTLATRS